MDSGPSAERRWRASAVSGVVTSRSTSAALSRRIARAVPRATWIRSASPPSAVDQAAPLGELRLGREQEAA